jgi:hypothetical protein
MRSKQLVTGLSVLLWLMTALCWQVAEAGEAKIYVVRESDGSLRFTNRPPLPGQEAQVFTSSGSGGRFFRTATPVRLRSGDTLYRSRASLRFNKPAGAELYPRRGRLFTDLYADATRSIRLWLGL